MTPVLADVLHELEHLGLDAFESQLLLQHYQLVHHVFQVKPLRLDCLSKFHVDAVSQLFFNLRGLLLGLLLTTEHLEFLQPQVQLIDLDLPLIVYLLVILRPKANCSHKLFEVLVERRFSLGVSNSHLIGNANNARHVEDVSCIFYLLHGPGLECADLFSDLLANKVGGPLAQQDDLLTNPILN